MTYKQLETSKEARLWLGQIIIPALTAGGLLYVTNSNVRGAVDSKVRKIKNKFQKKEDWT